MGYSKGFETELLIKNFLVSLVASNRPLNVEGSWASISSSVAIGTPSLRTAVWICAKIVCRVTASSGSAMLGATSSSFLTMQETAKRAGPSVDIRGELLRGHLVRLDVTTDSPAHIG